MTLRVVIVGMLAGAAAAKPPGTLHFRRIDDLKIELEMQYEKLKRQEDFPKKVREERLVILLGKGEKRFEGRHLTGYYVVETLLHWDAAEHDDPAPETLRILALLPEALKQRYALVMPIPKEQRYRASGPLVDALNSRYRHLRVTALACLEALYGTRLGYHPDLPVAERKKKLLEWTKRIRALRR